jgi:heme A synthase
MQETLRNVALGAYALWLVAVVLYVLGQLTFLPALPAARTGVTVGGAALVLYQLARWARRGYERIVDG